MQIKLALRVLLSILPLIALTLQGERVTANTETCEQIRNVRRLAIKEELNDETLAQLEYNYCGNRDNTDNQERRSHRGNSSFNILPPTKASEDCINLTVMMRLSRIGQIKTEYLRLVESRQIVACELPEQSTNNSFENWSNGQYTKSGDTWYYPNGQYAKSGDTWYYPNGQYAKSGDTWYYPNGQYAKSGDNNWYYPNGQQTSFDGLLSQSCTNVSRHECREILSTIRNNKNEFWRNLTVIQLAWQTYKNSQSKSK